MKIRNLYYATDSGIETIYGTPQKLLELIKLDGYFFRKTEAKNMAEHLKNQKENE
jgi:hypothetical protein